MKNSPIIGIFLGIIIVLVIVIFSLGYQVNKSYKLYHKETSRRIGTEGGIAQAGETARALEKEVETLNTEIKEERELVTFKNSRINELEVEINKLNLLKGSLEESLKNALASKESTTR
jgi:uncharacterized protein YlxW (UPF0749 family)